MDPDQSDRSDRFQKYHNIMKKYKYFEINHRGESIQTEINQKC